MKSSKKINSILFSGIFIVLFLPLWQMQFNAVDIKPLNGTIKTVAEPSFNITDWFNENYQSGVEKYLNQNFGFRNSLVRLNNEIQFFFFDNAQANGVIIGKENYLYEKSYITAYYGKDFIGKDSIDDQLHKLKLIQDSLKTRDIDIIMVFAPGKASFYPEYIPDKFDTIKGISNYQYFSEQVLELGINHIDFSKMFRDAKDTTRYCLYPKTGIHWSYYGMNVAMDSMARYIEDLRNIDLPDMLWDTIEVKKEVQGVDNDIEKGMNLIWPIPNIEMPYPKITIDQKNKIKPKTIVISDSFFWQLLNAGYSNSIFDGEFWFYNQMIYPVRPNGETRVSMVNLIEEIRQAEVIILLCTEPILKRKFWGFIDDAYQEVVLNTDLEREIQELISEIRNDKQWMEKVNKKAITKQISVDEMLRLDAQYMISLKKNIPAKTNIEK